LLATVHSLVTLFDLHGVMQELCQEYPVTTRVARE
jgi:hypothetical protein